MQRMTQHITQHAQRWRAVLGSNAPPAPEKGLERLWLAGQGLVARVRYRSATYLALAARVTQQAPTWRACSDPQLCQHTQRLRAAWRTGEPDLAQRIESLALVSEHARRTLNLEPFPVQIAGAAAILDGCIAEMATGEGKTLVAALAAALCGWRGRGCHVVTVNDYLVERDAQWMHALYQACDVSVGFIKESSTPEQRRHAYAADVTYATSKELAADFLRDRILLQGLGDPARLLMDDIAGRQSAPGERLLMRGLACAIVDEADSILIDEAVTPLIISGPGDNLEASDAARRAASLIAGLAPREHYRVDQRFQEVTLTSAGRDIALKLARDDVGVWRGARRAQELLVSALTARELFLRDRQYVVHRGRIVIVDEFTGRQMPDRMWRSGLHQAVEAKEGLDVQPMQDTLARVSFQRFFRSYRRLAGMTGTAREARAEFWSTYRLPVVTIPTNRPDARATAPADYSPSHDQRQQRVVQEVARVHLTGRPVLVGTRTVERSEALSAALRARGVEHHVLNAVRHDQEAHIIARAGQIGAVTIATNMAGRGTDITLGPGVAQRGGLHVIISEPHEARRIDRQFAGRAARQGDPGSVHLFASCADDVLRAHAPGLARAASIAGCPRWLAMLALRVAQRRAQALARKRRHAVTRTDDWLERGLGFAGSGRV